MKQFYLKITIILINCGICYGQVKFKSEDYIFFKESKSSKPILIINDSIMYSGTSRQQKPFLHTDYPDVLKNYIPFQITNKTYLVHSGCGPVLEYRNDSIVRIDLSFLHLNQINGNKFQYKNEIYFFGGYGLFTYKNIVTKFDFKSKEWNQIETFNNPPSPRQLSFSLLIKDDLYIFGGYENDPEKFLQTVPCDNIIWKLHLPSMEWTKIGYFDSTFEFNSKNGVSSSFIANEKLYILPLFNVNTIYEIDLKVNLITKFKSKTKHVANTFFDNKTNEVVYIIHNGDGTKSVFHSTIKEFLGNIEWQRNFILPWYKNINTIILIVFIMLFLTMITKFHKKIKNLIYKPKYKITYNADKKEFYFKGALIESLDHTELQILQILAQNSSRFISLNDLNHIFENEIKSDNFSSIIKRRELTMLKLLNKLQFILSISIDEIIIFRKNPKDKRLKEIKLKDFIITIR
jgi:hypothetical protein